MSVYGEPQSVSVRDLPYKKAFSIGKYKVLRFGSQIQRQVQVQGKVKVDKLAPEPIMQVANSFQ